MKKYTITAGVLMAAILAALALRPSNSATAPAEAAQAVPVAIATGGNSRPAASIGKPAAATTDSTRSASAVNPAQLAVTTNWTQFRPERIELDTPVAPLHFTVVEMEPQHGRTILRGACDDYPGAHFASAGSDSDWYGIAVLPDGNEYHYAVTGGRFVVTEIRPDDETCAPDDHAVPASTSPVTEAALAETDADASNSVDLLYVYDQATLTAAGNESALWTQVLARVASCNNMLLASQVTNLQWRLAAMTPMPSYTVTGKLEADLDAVTADATIATERQNMGADQVLLQVTGTRDYSGLAWRPDTPSRAHAFAAVASSSAVVSAHELGHNFGCHHDRQQDSATGNAVGYAYGYRYVGANSADIGTIMSYAGNRLTYYSNPDITNPADSHVLGIAAGNTDAADCARQLREQAAAMAAFYAPAEAPAITTQPQSTAVRRGNSLQLSVVATGNALHYQWKKDGANVGTDSATFSVAAAADTDAGAYTVVVSNALASVTSNTATVTVTTLPPPTITTQPTASTITAGQTLSFSVVASGEELKYQWIFNGADIAGATSATFSKSNAQTSDAGNYSVRVSNSVGSVTSSTAKGTVNAATTTTGSTTTGNSSSSSKGGGGGAIGYLFMVAISALFAFRRAVRVR